MNILALMDDCLIAITDGKELPATSLRKLPPWRAVLIARVANRAGIGIDDGTTLDELVEEAREAGGLGALRKKRS